MGEGEGACSSCFPFGHALFLSGVEFNCCVVLCDFTMCV